MRATFYDPFFAIRDLRNGIETPRNAVSDASRARLAEGTIAWAPVVDVDEHSDMYVISAEVPGIDPAAIEITIDDGVLSLSGERQAPSFAEDNGSVQRRERSFGRFLRRFTLPDNADAERVAAHSEHGVLKITVHKKAQPEIKKITVTH